MKLEKHNIKDKCEFRSLNYYIPLHLRRKKESVCPPIAKIKSVELTKFPLPEK